MLSTISPGKTAENRKPLLLLVEDDADQREVYRILFETKNYAVATAGSAKEAEGILGQIHVDLVVCDVNMPEISGKELISKIRASSGFSGLPIVSFSASSLHKTEDLINCGANFHCLKSEGKERLINVLELISCDSEKASLLDQVRARFE